MITTQQLEATVSSDGLLAFGKFILSTCGDGTLPDYERIELMEAPRLIPFIWVYDLRTFPEDPELRVNFAGEEFTRMFGRNIIGESNATIFANQPIFDNVTGFYRRCVEDKVVGYTRRYGDHALPVQNDKKYRQAESLFFPCSSDGTSINWGIGYVRFAYGAEETEDVFLQF